MKTDELTNKDWVYASEKMTIWDDSQLYQRQEQNFRPREHFVSRC